MSQITPLPPAPSRSDDSDVFVSKADAFVAALPTLVDEINEFSATISSADFTASSTTSNAIGSGLKSFTIEAGKSFLAGMLLSATSISSPSNSMIGYVQSYNSTTGALVIDVEFTTGSGTFTDWNIFITPANFNTASFSHNQFSGNGTQTTFTLSSEPASLASMMVFISGVSQRPNTDYTVNGTTLTLIPAPPTGTNNISVFVASTVEAGVPDDNSITTNKIVDGAVTTEKVSNAAITQSKLASAIGTSATQAEMEAGTETALRLMSPLRVKQAITAGAPAGIGSGQTWQNVTASRAQNTTYTNTTGKPILVFISANQTTSQGTGFFVATVNGQTLTGGSNYGQPLPFSISFIVQNGISYSVSITASSYNTLKWTELR